MGKYWAEPLGPAARPEKGPLRRAGKQTGISLLTHFLSTVITVSKKVENPALGMEKSSLLQHFRKQKSHSPPQGKNLPDGPMIMFFPGDVKVKETPEEIPAAGQHSPKCFGPLSIIVILGSGIFLRILRLFQGKIKRKTAVKFPGSQMAAASATDCSKSYPLRHSPGPLTQTPAPRLLRGGGGLSAAPFGRLRRPTLPPKKRVDCRALPRQPASGRYRLCRDRSRNHPSTRSP